MSEKEKIQFTDVNELGEFGLIRHLTKGFPTYHESTKVSVGDDAAVLKCGDAYMALSTDMLVEGIHFDRIYTPLKHLGYKAVIVNISDIVAMNLLPSQITVSVALSNHYSVEALEEVYAGIKKACEIYRLDLIGGDTTSSPRGLVISVTATGQTTAVDDIVYRNGAKKGDILCVTGDLGAAYLGLQLLEREKQLFMNDPEIQPDFENYQYLIERQLKPEARIDAIAYFSKTNLRPTSMIDISDGLSSEIFHICEQSDLGAYIEEGKVPIKDEARELAIKFNMDPITCALNGGEDYELLFTVSPEDLEKIRFMPGVHIIGEMTDKSDGKKLHTTGGQIHSLKAQGWGHF